MTLNRDGQRFAGLAADTGGIDDGRTPLVLLHGLTFDRTMWRPALAELERIDPGRRVLALDLPGHGDSTGSWAYDGASVGEALHASIEAAGLDAPVLVGHSLGAVAATFYASLMPVSGVVNVDQNLRVEPFARLLQQLAPALRGPRFADVWAQFASSMHAELLPEEAQILVRTTSNPRQDLVLGYWAQVLDSSSEELAEEVANALVAVRAANVPYTIIAGADPEPDYRSWLAAELPHATLTVWPGCGHFPHLAQPPAFARVLADTATWPTRRCPTQGG